MSDRDLLIVLDPIEDLTLNIYGEYTDSPCDLCDEASTCDKKRIDCFIPCG